MSHWRCTCKSTDSRIANIMTKAESTQKRQSAHEQMHSQNSRLLQFVTRVPCLFFSDSPCKAELSSINKKQAGKKLLGETHTHSSSHTKQDTEHTHTLKGALILTHRVCPCALACMRRPVFAILRWGGLLQVPPVPQQQWAVLVCGSLWQRGGWFTHAWRCRLW